MEKPLVSIIIPTYNRAHLIGETLDSIIAQTYTNWECIVVDDGSTDDTDQVVGEYLKKDPRFTYFHRPDTHKPGGNGARNYGFLQSEGEYIQWFDSDDIMYEDHLSLKVAVFLEDKDIDVVFCAYHYFDNNGIKNRISNNYFSGDIIQDKIEEKINYSTLSFMLCRKSKGVIQFDETLFKSQDLDFFFRLFTTNQGLKIRNIKNPLYKIRKHGDQISQTVSGDSLELKSKYKVHKNMATYFKKTNHIKGMRINIKHSHLQLKNLLEYRNFAFVFNEILNSGLYNFPQKLRLICCFLIYVITGRAINRFKNVL